MHEEPCILSLAPEDSLNMLEIISKHHIGSSPKHHLVWPRKIIRVKKERKQGTALSGDLAGNVFRQDSSANSRTWKQKQVIRVENSQERRKGDYTEWQDSCFYSILL